MAIAIAIAKKNTAKTPEVILPAYGCPDLVAAVLAQEAKPVLVDLVPGAPFMDLEQLKKAISSTTVALVGVGLLGIPERLDRLSQLCQDSGVTLIEDSAQCFPPASNRRQWADLIVLSFGRGKPVNLMGGGALLVRRNNLALAKQILEQFPLLEMKIGLGWKVKRMVFNLFLRRFPYFLLEKLPGLDIGETKFRALEEARRVALPEQLVFSGIHQFRKRLPIHRSYLAQLQLLKQAGWDFLDEETPSSNAQSVPRNRFAILAPSAHKRDLAERALNRAGIGASSFYRCILPEIDGVPEITGASSYPNARKFSDRLLTLPCHEDVTEADIALAAEVLIRSSQD
ncbi:DegT/DnrJ/EryC1/StrS family aminotransferase [Marinobacter apostichopi]|uniref:DegT/DnrJ/EryC1/StrS family aminotransferase n=1 Tax=Marinobacter apostichopi TaxID=3035454 RepID=UPI0025732447|nr:DegT/DnrJ/EryC1/StrS family aminotransferase [Marinobacter sp. LA51]